MRKRIWIYLLTVLCFYLTGCGSYRAIGMTRSGELHEAAGRAESRTLESGDKVRVTLDDGELIEGTFVAGNEICLTLDDVLSRHAPRVAGGDQEETTRSDRRVVPMERIGKIERRELATWQSVGIVAVSVGLLVASMVAIEAASWGWD